MPGAVCKVPHTSLPTGSQDDERETRAIKDCTKPVGLTHRVERDTHVWSILERASCQPDPLWKRLYVLRGTALASRRCLAHFTDVGRGCERYQPCSRSQRSSLQHAASWGGSRSVWCGVSPGPSRWSCALPAQANCILPSHTSRLKVQPRSTSLPGFHAPAGPRSLSSQGTGLALNQRGGPGPGEQAVCSGS